MKISTRTFSDRGNKFLLAFLECLHSLQGLLPINLFLRGPFDFDFFLQWFHFFLQKDYHRGELMLASLLKTRNQPCLAKRRLTNACSGARQASFLWFSECYVPRPLMRSVRRLNHTS